MREMIKMVVVVTLLAAASGVLLAAVRNGTAARIEDQELFYVKGPAILSIMKGCQNDPITDRFKIKDGEVDRSFFVGEFNGKPDVVAFETSAGGFGGPIGVMVAININDDKIVGIGVTTHSETPGLGARAKEDPSFAKGFVGKSILEPLKVRADGGQIDALAGATITSRAVCAAVTSAGDIYKKLKTEIAKDAAAVQLHPKTA
ncbi:MAG: RnfABCDGE type electron transport complex subunit G [Thermodesulfobacteriota bacterium]